MALCGCCASKPSPTNSASEDESTGPESKEEILLANQNGNASTYENIRKRSAAKRDKKHAEYGKRKMREVFAYYINHCTLHGFHYIFETKSLFRKIAWFSVLAIAGGFFFKEIKTSTTQYFKYPFSIMSTVEYPRTLVFPAVTICDFHDIRQTLVSNAKGEQAINISSSEKLETLARKTYKSFNETLISCSLRRGVRGARPFNIHDFKVFFTAKGQTCYTFNAAMDGKKLLEVDNVGPKFGLEIYLNAQHWWFKDDVRESGFRFILHQQDDLPLTREGFRVSSGYVTYVDMRLEKASNDLTQSIYLL
ncbi:predicted protein [Nematostella vectensis]|uniref:Uncharacterized protein n=1 Tax=Nematostella vectensis TaxID=45351 RepID=A7RI83_NEMVE|nr:predicted protein [Nematostella vectensis]|eukprot:XP_001640720.1 predicted protein [Nematostella vectensis]